MHGEPHSVRPRRDVVQTDTASKPYTILLGTHDMMVPVWESKRRDGQEVLRRLQLGHTAGVVGDWEAEAGREKPGWTSEKGKVLDILQQGTGMFGFCQSR